MVILNDYKAVLDLFDRRGNIYSSRPENHIAKDILFRNDVHALFTPYGDKWLQLRKIFQQLLRTSSVDKFIPLQAAESTRTLHQLLHDPNRWYDHIRRYTMSVMLASIFGLQGASFDSPRVKTLWHITEQNTAINELGATPPIDIFPFLKLLPDFMSPWRKWAWDIRKDYRKWLFGLVQESREYSKQPNAPDCFLNRLFRDQEKSGLDDEGIAYIGSSMTLRWRPTAAGGIPHTLTQDDHYEGYFFPKDTIFFANAWSIHRSEDFSNPDDFIPERWLGNKLGINKVSSGSDVQDESDGRRAQYVFGAGRRVCSGQRMAENSLMISLSKLVWAFDFTAPPNTKIDTSIETGYEGGFLVTPKKFPLDIKPRSSEHAAVIEKEMKEVAPLLDTFVVAVSLNYRDIAIPLGKFPSPARESYVPTSDGAGIVIAVGDQVKMHRVGDRVCTLFTQDHQKGLFKMAMKKSFLGASVDGPLRQYATYPETGLVQVPKSMTLIEASTLPCAALTAWNSLFGLEGRKVSPGDWVLTQGTGGVSLFAAQLALAAGAKVIHTTSSDKKGETLKTLGVHHIINYKTDPSWGETAKKLTGGEGCAHVIDVGGEETIAQSFAAVKEEGVISVVGFLGNPEGKHNPDLFGKIFGQVAIVRGIEIGSREQFVEMCGFMERHWIRAVVDERVFGFGKAKGAFVYLREQRFVGKVVVRVAEEDS
ncbi:hypothetical protein PRZ48_011227 [Zasmidium cellare]|uniref:Enoyl reductase (ER) domain-containing protein n=1 Tax=Zasmidium cellare TaxID=395010 RepID=A0ABR0EB44_ZASCE|nr:hypothetical protein PRZ48_011227 [Zasmidium cellare]